MLWRSDHVGDADEAFGDDDVGDAGFEHLAAEPSDSASLLVLSVNILLYLSHNAVVQGVVDVVRPIAKAIAALIAGRRYAARLRGHRCAQECRGGPESVV